MTASPQPDRLVTAAELEAMEGRVISRLSTAINEAETRLVRDINTAFWRQLLGFGAILLGLLAVLATILFFAISNLYALVGALQPR